MPQRFLRPGITNSALWNKVSIQAQNLFIRLLTLVDDYGRYDGRASVVCGQCFSVWNELNPKSEITLAATGQLLQQLAAGGLIDVYEADGKLVLQIEQWQERVRDGSKERWPKNPTRSVPQQPAATRSVPLPPSSPSPSAPASTGAGIPPDSLSKVELINQERKRREWNDELRAIKEELNGRTPADATGSNSRKRIETLIARQAELRTKLGRVA